MTNDKSTSESKIDFVANVMQRIESEKIQTKSRVWFILHDLGFWSLWFLSALIGAFALSATVFVIQSSSWRWYLVTHDSFLDYATDVMPYVWLVLFGLMCVIAYVNLRHTPKGYKYSFLGLIVLNLGVTVLLAGLLTAAGLGKFVDEQVGKHIPLYSSISKKQELEWFKPSQGLLIGEVAALEQTQMIFILTAPDASELVIDGHLLSEGEWRLLEVEKVRVRVIGVPKESAPFVACVVLPVLPPGISPALARQPIERNFMELRNTECKGVQPYDRFDQLKHW
ncbi:MAG: hypothetical protein WAZ14_03285 [Patescibacteria group bacterium]